MNSASNSPAGSPDAISPPPIVVAFDWQVWLRRLLGCNPFFLVSAALLLFGVNRLSLDPEFLGNETQNLLFNFGALQVYGGLLVVTAVLLAGRRIWYDSTLLVVLEHGLVLVPFILISQAALIGSGLAGALAVGGAMAAAGRAGFVRRWYPQINLPFRALMGGALILGFNVALPLWFRSVVNATSVVDWPGPNRFVWLIALPLLAAGVNQLPKPRRYGGLNPERSWLPLLIFGLWLAGCMAHATAVAYLGKGATITTAMLAPLAAVIAWSLWNRRHDFNPAPSFVMEQVCLVTAGLAPVLAWDDQRVLLTLSLLNLTGFMLLGAGRRDRVGHLATQLGLASVVLVLIGLPAEWLTLPWSGLNHGEMLRLAFGLYAVGLSWLSRRALAGLAGGVALLLTTSGLHPGFDSWFAWQISCVALVCHSLRWEEASQLSIWLRRAVPPVWVLTVLLPRVDGLNASSPTVLQGLVVLAAWGIAWWALRKRPTWGIPGASVIVLLAQPITAGTQHGSPGLLALVASFALFGIGIIAAWKRRQEPATTGHVS